jgi:hypothetical protein
VGGDDAGHDEPALHVANRCLRADKRLGAFVVPHIDDVGPVYGDGFRPGLFFIDRVDLTVDADRVGGDLFLGRLCFSSKHACAEA